MKRLFFILGRSGAGKDTLARLILKRFPQIRNIVGGTTRPMRSGEENGKEYHFMDYEGFKKLHLNGEIVEFRRYNTMNGTWIYFTPISSLEFGDDYGLMVGVPESFNQIRKYIAKNKLDPDAIIPIFIQATDYNVLTRLIERTAKDEVPNYCEMCRRFVYDKEKFISFDPEVYNSIIIDNDHLERAKDIVFSHIQTIIDQDNDVRG